MTAAMPMTTPKSVRTERNLFAQRERSAIRIASAVFMEYWRRKSHAALIWESRLPSALQVYSEKSLTAGKKRLSSRLRGPGLNDVAYNVFCRQPDRTVAFRAFGRGERKVRTPQSSVPDNVRDVRFKSDGRKVPQKTYRLGGNAG